MSMKLQFTIAFLTLFTLVIPGCKKDPVTPAPVVVVPPVVTPGKSYYVSVGSGADANTGLSSTAPFQTIKAGIAATTPGDTVFIMNGVYDQGSITITKPGTADRYITVKAYPGHSPRIISGTRSNWGLFNVNASYYVIEGLEFVGNNANITYALAQASYLDASSGTNRIDHGLYNTNGVGVNGAAGAPVHHVTIRNCKIHDFAAMGLGTGNSDYITFEGNTVYNNDWYCMYASSGIGTGNLIDTDNSTGYKIFIRKNICYNNYGLIFWINITPNRLSDGNGIIVDINTIPYNGRTLVENNVSFNNGGSGMHTLTNHVDIINNTAYGNGTVVGYADIFSSYGTDVKIANNIMYSRTGGKCNTTPAGTSVIYDYNLYYNGIVATQGLHDKIGNPMFVNLSTDGSIANFMLTAGSPAINAGTQMIFSASDILGTIRPQGGAVDCGAYEFK